MSANLHLHHDKPVDAPLIAVAFSDLQKAHPSANLKLCSLEISQERDKLHLMAVASPQADLNALRAEYFARLNHLISLFAHPDTQNLVLALIGKMTLNFTRSHDKSDRIWHYLLLSFS